MKILLISSALRADTAGGAEHYVEDLAEALSVGHDVSIATGSRATPQTVQVHRLPPPPAWDADAGPVRKAYWHAVDQWRPSVYRRLLGLLQRERPDVVHTHRIQGLSAAVFDAVGRAQVPHVHTAHDFNLVCVRQSLTRAGLPCRMDCASCVLQRRIRAPALQRSDARVISPSRFVLDRHVELAGVGAAKPTVIRQGAAPGHVRRRENTGSTTFGYIGQLAGHKGVRTLLDAMARSNMPSQLHVAGSGPLAPLVREACGRDRRIKFHGSVDGRAKDEFYAGVDVLVVPSEWLENAPIVLAEAAVRAIPAIVSDLGGLPETPLAWVVPAQNCEVLARMMERLSRDPSDVAKRKRMLEQRHVEFTWERHVRLVEDILVSAACR